MARLLPRSIRGLIALVGGVFALVTLLLGLATYEIVDISLEGRLNARITRESKILLTGAAHGGDIGVAAAVHAREARRSMANMGYLVIDPAGHRIAGSLNAILPPPGYWDCLPYEHADGRKALAQSLNSAIPGGGRLVVAADRTSIDTLDDMLLALFAGAFGLILLLGFGSAILFGRVVQDRLSAIAKTAEAIMAGDLSLRMPVTDGRSEFDQLAILINRMLDRIEILLDNLRQISTDIAHDLRSPLNRLRGQLERADDDLRDMPQQALITEAMREADAVLDLLTGLLGISEIEGFAVRKRFIRIDLAALAEDLVDGYRPAIEGAGLSIEVRGDHAARIIGDASLLRRCLANLLDNSILHTGPGTHITVSVTRRDQQILLSVADDGPGVGANERETIFRRFVRLDRSRSTPGHGLGLNMVAAIAKAHFGSVCAVPTATGLRIELSLPAAPVTETNQPRLVSARSHA